MKKDEARQADYARLLDQGKWWRPADGIPVKITKLDRGHVFNILAMLERRAPTLASDLMSPLIWSAPDDVWAEVEYAWEHPKEWMREKPLYRALLAEICK
jgi:hypothetical protein